MYSIVIPLEQGLRPLEADKLTPTFDYSIVIPLEQGLRLNPAISVPFPRSYSIVIPLEQGLRRCGAGVVFVVIEFYCHSIRTRIKTRHHAREHIQVWVILLSFH